MKIIAHRGDTAHHPENTLSSFKAALENGADAIELDVHTTRDGSLVVHHDYYLGKPDNGSGLIFKKDISYIQSLKIDETETVPTLEEVFKAIGRKLHYELELKGVNEESLAAIIGLAKKHDLAEFIEFTSSSCATLTRLKALNPALKTGMFTPLVPVWMGKDLAQQLLIDAALLGGMDVIHCPVDMLDGQFIELAHSKNLIVHAADCETAEFLRQAFLSNADQLSTSNLQLALAVRRELSL